MNKIKLLLALAIILVVQKNASAQESSILPGFSESYLEKLIAVAKANYPKVRSNQYKIDEAKANVGKAGVSYLDNLTISYIYQPKTSTVIDGQTIQSQFNGFQAGIFFNIGSFLEKPYMVKVAKQELLVANEDQNEYMLTLTNDVKKRYYTYIASKANLTLITQSYQETLNAFTDVKSKFEKGEQTFDNYSKAQVGLTASKQAQIAAETNLLIAKADIEELLGEKLEDIK
jgi:outer membrane protein TolC